MTPHRRYAPRETHNWLTNWNGSATAPASLADVPVTYVGLAEAQAYCAWANGGSRLPHSYEWQYAAQGLDGRLYPWGGAKDQACYPAPHTGHTLPGAPKIGTFPASCDSPFGVKDLVGNVWQYTDEFQDTHTRTAVLRGGSNYKPHGSTWQGALDAARSLLAPGAASKRAPVPALAAWNPGRADRQQPLRRMVAMRNRYYPQALDLGKQNK